ncbi:hypothetical protein PENSPDRAFT_656592 [Peniophora sp. CONT]|nr:hypothetical protein PENSPDRAFT_656592 [Peniophora sp. CONT]
MESGSWDEHVDGRHPDLEIVLPVNDGGAKAMMMVLEELAPHSIRALTLTNAFSSLLPSFVHPVFRHIVALHIPRSTISSCSNAKCLHFLATTSGTMLPFPLLKTLILSHQSPYGVLSLVSNTIHTNPQNQINLQDCIFARHACGTPLRAVYLDISEIQKVLDGQTKPRTNWAPVFLDRIEIRRVINGLKKIPEVIFLPGTAQLYDDALWRTIVGESS